MPGNTGGAVPPNNYGQVVTIAGTGKAGTVNGTGRQASFSAPLGLGCDATGDIFVGDYNNNVIREITPLAVVSTFAGSFGSHGAANGRRSQATFTLPQGVAMDEAGNMYIADSYNDLIRKITPGGIVSTLAGQTGVAGSTDGMDATFNSPTGVAVDHSGNVYVADQGNNTIRKITPSGNVSTLAGTAGVAGSVNGMNATFNLPTGVTIDNFENLYVADAGNNLIRMITPAGLVSTFAGNGAKGFADGQGLAAVFNYPTGITIDDYNNIYIADEHNNIIRKITPTGNVTTLAGNGSPGWADGVYKNATFSYPGSVAADNMGNLYVGDISTYLIRKITLTGYTINKPLPAGLVFDATTGIISGIPAAVSPATDYIVTAYNAVGSSTAVVNITVNNNGVILQPPNIAYQSPQVYVVNTPIQPLSPTNTGGAVPANTYGLVSTYAGSSSAGNTNGPALKATFNGPVGLAFDESGNLFVSENVNNDIREISAAGVVSTFAGNGRAALANGPGSSASFYSPAQIAFDGGGNLYVADEQNQLIRKITQTGVVSSYAGSGGLGSADGTLATATLNNPFGLAIDPSGIMYIGDNGNNTIRKVDLAGQVSTFLVLDDGSAPPNNYTALYYLTTDAQGNLYYTDNNQVGQVTPAGAANIFAGSGNPTFGDGVGTAASFFKPNGIARSIGGFTYVADGFNNRIRSISATGAVTTIAGEFGSGFSDGLGSTAAFSDPAGVALDATGNYLYVADYGNNLIRKVAVTGYTIDKSLPTGLTFNPVTGIISGTPTIATPAQNYTVTAYNAAGSSSATISIETIVEQTVYFAPLMPKTVCDADFSPGATGSGPISYASSDPSVATIVNGDIHITGTGTVTITASDGISQATQILTVTGSVTPTISITPAPSDTCQGKTMVFAAQITGGGTQPSLQWQINGQNVGSNSQEFSTAALNAGDQVTCTLTSNAPCMTANMVTSNTSVFSVDPPVSTSVMIMVSDTGLLCKGTPVTFTAVAYSPDLHPNYQWKLNSINTGLNQSTFTSNTLNDGDEVSCLVTSVGKCLIDPETTSNTITVKFSPRSLCTIEIPNAFTPNGDGVNDLWHIEALQAYPGCTVSIFNRTGALVYNSVNYSKPWDGTLNGQKLPVGTYYYVIDLKNGRKPLSGYVTIIR